MILLYVMAFHQINKPKKNSNFHQAILNENNKGL